MKKKRRMRSTKTIKKRLFFLPNGDYKRWHANTSHLAFKKKQKRKRQLKKSTFLNNSDFRRLKKRMTN